ncbi:MAG: GSCFA domain-containing protein, partial [Bacteroidetes bacterium]|nr:GSCFA domain-containing protein [Bacteroidota bacterium]
HQDGLLLIGSCFSEHIGNRLNDLKFNVNSNPFGIVFNPKSIETSLSRIIHQNYFTAKDVFEKEGLWYSFEAHSSVCGSSEDELLKTLNQAIDIWNEQLKSAHWLTVTFGSAFAYKHLERHSIVANCHKLPQALFEKHLLEASDIITDYNILLNAIKQHYPQIRILFTVSPVKHLRDGVVENNLSKAMLIQSVHSLIKEHTNCFYFPAFELVNDDLRDYRFYESDMAHPNKQAIDYVWKRFEETYFNDKTQTINEKVTQIHQAYHHRLFNETTSSSLKFKHKFYQQCVTLQAEYPYLNLTRELQYFNTFQD